MTDITSTLSAKLAGAEVAEDTGSEGNWLIIEQAEIPEEQQVATVEDFYTGIRQLQSGQSAHTAFTGKCPVTYSGAAGSRRKVNYDLIFHIHHAGNIEYEIEVTKGGELLDYSGPTQGIIPQGKAWIIDKNKTQQLGWRPYNGLFRAKWEIGFVDGKRVANLLDYPEVEQVDGFIYLVGDTIQGSLFVSGSADADTYRVRITQGGGTEWRGDLYVTAWWPAGVPREDQQSVAEELFLPECVIEEIEKCAEAIKEAEENGDDPGSVSGYYPPIHYDVDDCSGKVIGRTPNTEPSGEDGFVVRI